MEGFTYTLMKTTFVIISVALVSGFIVSLFKEEFEWKKRFENNKLYQIIENVFWSIVFLFIQIPFHIGYYLLKGVKKNLESIDERMKEMKRLWNR